VVILAADMMKRSRTKSWAGETRGDKHESTYRVIGNARRASTVLPCHEASIFIYSSGTTSAKITKDGCIELETYLGSKHHCDNTGAGERAVA
jgi:hypothetical protein